MGGRSSRDRQDGGAHVRRRFRTVYGVDFSGARMAGRTTWIAKARWEGRGRARRLRLVALDNLESLSGAAERAAALAHLVERIARSRGALWAIGAPFGLPLEVLDDGMTWPRLLRWVRGWEEHAGYDLGLWALARAKERGHPQHVYRATDRAARTPFDAYHYRIIYQTFHGMRDVLWPLTRVRETAIMPFHYRRLAGARRVVVETCQSSTLKRLGLPHQNYKQPAGGPLTWKRLRTRHRLMDWLAGQVVFDARHRRVMMRNGGGDALDAVIAGVGASLGWREADHAAIRRHPRYRREGRMFV